jgi:hypothetical protein
VGAGHSNLQKLVQHAFARDGSPYNARKTHRLPFAKLFLREYLKKAQKAAEVPVVDFP